eukprot:1644106-Rhodomonas_salina.2
MSVRVDRLRYAWGHTFRCKATEIGNEAWFSLSIQRLAPNGDTRLSAYAHLKSDERPAACDCAIAGCI